MAFDEASTSAEELREHYMGKNKNPNLIVKLLSNPIFRCIGKIVATLPDDYRVLEVGCGPGESTRQYLSGKIWGLVGRNHILTKRGLSGCVFIVTSKSISCFAAQV